MKTRTLAVALLICLPHVAAAQDQAPATAGAAIYQERCAECHGPRMVSTGAAFDLRELRADERARFDKSVLEGLNQMPSWAGVLEPADLDKLWAYQRTRARD